MNTIDMVSKKWFLTSELILNILLNVNVQSKFMQRESYIVSDITNVKLIIGLFILKTFIL